MGTVIQDLRYGARMLWKNLGFTLVALVALMLGIGATSAIYTLIDAVLLRPLPFPRPDQLVSVQSTLRGEPGPSSYLDAMDLRARSRTIAELAVYRPSEVVLTGVADPIHLSALESSPSLLRVLGVSPALGRDYADADAHAGADVALLSNGLWIERYGGDPGVIGKTIGIDGRPVTVIGVLPAGFRFPLDAGADVGRIYLPYPRTAEEVKDNERRGQHGLRVVARLKADVTEAQARADLEAVAASLRHDYPAESDDKNLGVLVETLRDQLVKPVRSSLLMLLVAVACVLFIACVNVAGLLLSRATVRQREMAIRSALGAGRGRIVRQMLTESALLGLLGGGAGALLSLWLVDLLVALLSPTMPKLHDIRVDGRALCATFAIALGSGFAFGLWPALQASRTELSLALKETARSTAHASRRARNLLLMAEIAVAVVLLSMAGQALRSFSLLERVHPGFRPDGLVIAQLQLPPTRYADDDAADRYYRTLSVRLASLPGMQSIAFGAPLPFSNTDISLSVSLPGQPPNPALTSALFAAVSPDYFKTLSMPLLCGRGFTGADDDRRSSPVLVVSESFARRMFGRPEDAIGKHVQIGFKGLVPEIVGVVGDTRNQSLDQPIIPTMFSPIGRTQLGLIGVVVRSAAPKAMIRQLHDALLDVDRDLPPPVLSSMESLMAETTQTQQALAILLGVLAALALALSSIGVYGVLSYTVTQRTREIGIRMALGAGPRQVLTMVMGESLRLSLVAVAIGLGGALLATRALRSILYGVPAVDPGMLLLVALTILLVCLLASYLPARRATKVDPMVALRYE